MSTLDALPGAVAAVAGRAEVFIDGGIRRGADIAKACALGAQAVLVGRPALYGVGAGGYSGAQRMLEIFREELDRALALIGCPVVTELNAGYLTGVDY
jgi:isopentenyl diphosphate isomerase/L-lactate dehydrogenase-like FMN-dependent dehydrogenase